MPERPSRETSEGALDAPSAPARGSQTSEAPDARTWAAVAHELSNAITTIAGWADVAASAADPAVARHAIETVRASARDAMDVAPLLLTRDAKGESSDVASTVSQVVERFGPIALARGVRLVRRRIDGGKLDTSRAALSSIVANLVKNAIEACERSGRVEIGVRSTGPGVEIVVEDDGAGMSADTLAALFGPGATPADTSRMRGVGVSVVRALVERAGGSIRATSELGQGSCVRVALPRAQQRVISGVRERVLRHVLVVDDHAALTDLVGATLEARGVKVRVARTPAEAIEAAESERFDVALVDLDLGGSSGESLVRALVDRALVPRVIVMTGASAIPELGAHALLRKPFDLVELEQLLSAPAPSPRARRAR